jgi:integrase/recombinase XerD
MWVPEAVTLPLSALRKDARMLAVKGKGRKERMVPLHQRAIQTARNDVLGSPATSVATV